MWDGFGADLKRGMSTLKTSLRTVALVSAAAALGLAAAQACGPDFQIAVTTCGSLCLREIRTEGMSATFAAALSRVASPFSEKELSSVHVSDLERVGLSADQQAELVRMRAAATGDQAYAVGADLPAAIRLYTAGAVDFLRVHPLIPYEDGEDDPAAAQPGASDRPSREAGFTAAIARFQAVTTLPVAEAKSRLLWAEYMLGRAYRLRGLPGDLESAESHFKRVIALVKAGSDDPMTLGNAALGELGGIALQRHQLERAMTLYAQQARSPGASYSLISLQSTVDQLAGRPDYSRVATSGVPDAALRKLLMKPLPQRLLVAFATDRVGMTCDMDACSTIYPNTALDSFGERLVTTLKTIPSGQLVAADQIAALAYYYGDYDFATEVVDRSHSPLADWIEGKLALHRGALQEAEAAFARAAPHFPPTRDDMHSNIGQRFHAEWGVLKLQRHDYAGALDLLLHDAPAFQADISYIAERVMTVSELERYVDGHPNCGDLVHSILATRLARDGRKSAAVAYYPGAKDAAQAYAQNWKLARHAKIASDRAKAWYELAQLDIEVGMELEGSQLAPDGGLNGGSFGPYYDTPSDIATADERARFQASRIEPDRRYHYRAVAVSHLLRAASELPKHSAVVSAVLCQGASLLRAHGEAPDGDLVKRLYRRYQADGLHEDWDRNFGKDCPEPQFESTPGNITILRQEARKPKASNRQTL